MRMCALSELVLELTDWCPLNCKHCSSNSGPTCRNHLSGEAALRLVREASELGAAKISLGGGEPTASPNLLAVVESANRHLLAAEVFTCGAMREGDRLGPLSADLMQALASVGGVKLIFSVHGPDSNVHDGITRSPGSFACLIASLDACLARGMDGELNFVPLRPNRACLEGIVELAEARGIERVSVLRFVPQGRGLGHRAELELTRKEEDRSVEELVQLRATTEVEIRTGSPFNGIMPGNRVPCRAGQSKLVVQADGNVLPCEVFKHSERRSWGLSIHRQSLAEILCSPQLLRLRAQLAESACLDCPVHSSLRSEQRRGMENVLA